MVEYSDIYIKDYVKVMRILSNIIRYRFGLHVIELSDSVFFINVLVCKYVGRGGGSGSEILSGCYEYLSRYVPYIYIGYTVNDYLEVSIDKGEDIQILITLLKMEGYL